MAKRRYKRELHDAFENDEGLDLNEAQLEEGASTAEAIEDIFEGGPPQETIERLSPSRMIPDRYQPRPILPVDIHRRYFSGEIDCYEAAKEWIALSRKDDGHEKRIKELVSLAETVVDHGQIKPITGQWIPNPSGDGFLFQIETGERRFWGACLKSVLDGAESEPVLRVEAVEAPSIERQIVENRHAEPPSAVAQAREIAGLILHRMDILPTENFDDPYDYFRNAIELPDRERMPKGFWSKIQPLMQLSPRRMRQILAVLELRTGILEKADRFDLSYRVLAAIHSAPEEIRSELIDQAVEQDLSGEEVQVLAARLIAKEDLPKKRSQRKADPAKSALRGLRGFSNAFQRVPSKRRGNMLDDLADEIMVTGEAPEIVGLLDELSRLVRARMKRE